MESGILLCITTRVSDYFGISMIVILLLFLFVNIVQAQECEKLLSKVKSASEFVLGINYPYWYNLGQIRAETNCQWKTSLDGLGSIGYAQITLMYWDKYFKFKYPEWKIKNSIDHFYAQAEILKELKEISYCNKLWIVYQGYNRNIRTVNEEARIGKCEWEKAMKVCNEKNLKMICVWRDGERCLQYRSNCDINYSYGLKVYKHGSRYKKFSDIDYYSYW